MKNHVLAIAAIAIMLFTSCEQKIDIEQEEAAIKAVIENESLSFWGNDFEQQITSFKQDESLILLGAASDWFELEEGWEEIGKAYKEMHSNMEGPSQDKRKFENYKIRISNDMAWAVYDENVFNDEGEILWNFVNCRVLEKIEGEWKIAFLAFVNATSYDNKEVMEPDHDEGEEHD